MDLLQLQPEQRRVQWAPKHAAATGEFLICDSKDPDGPVLSTSAAGWAGLVAFAAAQA
ncbi:DUF397 domain-containing protein [Streptomyces sp. TR1341]|uniref:DUF397 domain-containing protein n=1 Tax=Streptomyces sp. TR1341 TaxID=2601266 RepID=UPI00192EA1CE